MTTVRRRPSGLARCRPSRPSSSSSGTSRCRFRTSDLAIHFNEEEGRIDHLREVFEFLEGTRGITALDFDHRTRGEYFLKLCDRVESEEPSRVHQGDAVTAFGFVHIVSRDEHRDAVGGKVVLDDLDVWTEAGHDHALKKVIPVTVDFPLVPVTAMDRYAPTK